MQSLREIQPPFLEDGENLFRVLRRSNPPFRPSELSPQKVRSLKRSGANETKYAIEKRAQVKKLKNVKLLTNNVVTAIWSLDEGRGHGAC